MATRLYLSSLAVTDFTPTPDASWEKTTGFVRRRLARAKTDLAAANTSIAGQGTAGNDTLLVQYISEPLNGAQTIGGGTETGGGQIRALEGAAGLDARMQAVLRVIASDGTTVRGTLIAHSAAALASEWPTGTAVNRKIPLGGAVVLPSVSAQDGDRLVLEVGFRQHAASTSTGLVQSEANSAVGDLGVNETDNTELNPWFEFSQNLSFDDITAMRASQIVQEVVYTPTSRYMRASQVVLEVVQSNTYTGLKGSAAGGSSGVGTLSVPGGERTYVVWVD